MPTYGYTVRVGGSSSYGVSDCETKAEALNAAGDFAERMGVKFRQSWWQFWRPVDPRTLPYAADKTPSN